jgi:hypothetical protein
MNKELVDGCLRRGDRHLATAPGRASSLPSTSALLLASTAPRRRPVPLTRCTLDPCLTAPNAVSGADRPPIVLTADRLHCFPIDDIVEVQLHA